MTYSWPLMKESITIEDRIKIASFALTTKQFTQGPKVAEFEKAWSDWLGASHSVYVTSGSTANFLLIASVMEKYGLKPGDKVLVPACTWVTNVNPIIQLGLKPIFCDINLDDYGPEFIDLWGIAKKHDIKIVFVSHLLGLPVDYPWKDVFPNAIVLHDVCESHGVRGDDGNRIGSDAIGATFSFYFGHHMSTIEGGMVSTNDEELYEIMKMKRSHGLARVSGYYDKFAEQHPDILKSFLFVTDGYNFRNTEIGAVLGLSQLKRLDKYIDIRRERYDEYIDIIDDLDERYLIHGPAYAHGNSCFCFPFVGVGKDVRDSMIQKFEENGIEYRPIVGGNLLRQPYLKKFTKNMPNADILHENGVYIGCNQFVTSSDMKRLRKIMQTI